jgi:pimeloyl-ACP methyl ester carboxylesterase
VDVPDVSYARSGDVAIAYQVVGKGPPDLVTLMFMSNLYMLWKFPRFAEFGRALASDRRLILINPRGAGLSDRPRGWAIIERVRDLGLDVRAGIHTGECERVGEKIAGLAVNVGARVSAAAGAGEVLVSGTVKDLVAGSGIEFADRGAHELKGVPGEWRLYAVSSG